MTAENISPQVTMTPAEIDRAAAAVPELNKQEAELLNHGMRSLVQMQPNLPAVELAGGMRLDLWCRTVGISRRTALRWRRQGKLSVVTRCGMLFLTAGEIRNFFKDDGSSSLRGVALARQVRRQAGQQF